MTIKETEPVASAAPEVERPRETRAERIRPALEALLFSSPRPVSEKDLADVPADIQGDFVVHFVESMDEVLKVALTRSPVPLEEEIGAETGFRPYIEKDSDTRRGPVMH